jgi:hypothetical protein
MNPLTFLLKGWRRIKDWWTPVRRVRIAAGDVLPSEMPSKDLVLVKYGGEDWSVGFLCPCGCGESIELALLKEVRPRWDLVINSRGLPTLSPSVWKKTGCRSHFWLRDGVVHWCT